MFAGHVGAALAVGRAGRRMNVAVFVFAALLMDILLWLFVLAGLESVSIPADFTVSRQARFIFPLSHGFVGSLFWSFLAALVVYLAGSRFGDSRQRLAALTGAAVFSHWVLDALVHVPELPLGGSGSKMVGLGLWRIMPLALTVEGLIVAAGLWLFLPGAPISRGKKIGMCVLSAAILGFTVFGMTAAPAPPSVNVMAVSSLGMVLVVSALAWWLGRPSGKGRT